MTIEAPEQPEVRQAAAAPPLPVRLFLKHEVLRYVIAGLITVATMVTVPGLLNNMILTLAVFLGVVAFLPQLLKRRYE